MYILQDLMKDAYWAMGIVASMVNNVGSDGLASQHAEQLPQIQRLLQAPQLVPCFALQLTITALAVDMNARDTEDTVNHQHNSSGSTSHQQHQSSSGSGSSSEGSSSMGAGSHRQGNRSTRDALPGEQQQQQQQQGAPVHPPGVVDSIKCLCCFVKLDQDWQLACEWHSSLTPCHHKLFELLGVDARAVLWAAAVNRRMCSGCSSLNSYLVPHLEHVTVTLHKPLQQASTAKHRQQLERQLHLLLPAVLMHHMVSLPAEHARLAELYWVVAQGSNAAMSAWEHLLP